jgi:hypothetical protein
MHALLVHSHSQHTSIVNSHLIKLSVRSAMVAAVRMQVLKRINELYEAGLSAGAPGAIGLKGIADALGLSKQIRKPRKKIRYYAYLLAGTAGCTACPMGLGSWVAPARTQPQHVSGCRLFPVTCVWLQGEGLCVASDILFVFCICYAVCSVMIVGNHSAGALHTSPQADSTAAQYGCSSDPPVQEH